MKKEKKLYKGLVRVKERKRKEKKSEIGNPKTNLKWWLLLHEREGERE